MEIAGRTIQLMQEHDLSYGRVAMDAGGGGKQIADRLAEQGRPVLLVGFGEAAEAKQSYKNRRAELYGGLRGRMTPEAHGARFLVPPHAYELRQELAVFPFLHDSEGRLFLPPKNHASDRPGVKSIRQMLGRSPDRADSLVLAVWVLDRLKQYNFSDYVLYDDDDRDLTPEELEATPRELREIIKWYDERERRYGGRRRGPGRRPAWDWDDDY